MQTTEPEDRKWYLAARALTATLAPEEEIEWKEIMQDQTFNTQFERVRKYWNETETLPYLQINTEADWQQVAGKIRTFKETKERRLLPVLKYAAAVAAVIVVSMFAWKLSSQSDGARTITKIEAPKGARTSITLPDSSHVWLNAESRITFDQEFGKDNRDLTLEGEAFFDVTKDNVPFNVRTNAYDIAVLGTAFNVKSYPDDDISTTTLVHGSLKVTRLNAKGDAEEFLLRPNERIVLRGDSSSRINNAITLEKNIDAAAEADWKDGWLTVRGESLEELSKKIERLYNVRIEFQNDKMKSYRYSGRIQQFSLEQVMNALALTSPVRFEIHEKLVKLSIDESATSKYNVNP
jgi:ferric-dicitrate binding protein FerR (iron transport regulator)